MVAEQFIMNAYAAIVSWTYILLTILLIVKIIQLFSGGGILGGGRRREPDDDTSRRRRNTVSPEDEEKRKDDERNGKPEGLDLEHPGYVQVIVWDEDDNPIQGAKVRITPARIKKRKGLLRKTKQEWREYGDLTGPDGAWPGGGRYEQIGSGSVTVSVTKGDFINIDWWNEGKFYQQKDYEILPNEKHDIVVHMARKGEKAEHFEPKITDPPENLPDNRMRLKGIIN